MHALTREWIDKAEGDYWTAQRELRARKQPNHDAVCFHAQQCAEKYLKPFMQHHSLAFRFTHNLIELLTTIVTTHPDFTLIRDPLLRLDQYSVAPRYPLYTADKAEA